MEFLKFTGHPRGEGRASLGSMQRQVEGPGDCRMGHLVMLAAW